MECLAIMEQLFLYTRTKHWKIFGVSYREMNTLWKDSFPALGIHLHFSHQDNTQIKEQMEMLNQIPEDML